MQPRLRHFQQGLRPAPYAGTERSPSWHWPGMKMTTILLKLAGPLQSYGVDSHFETRQTQRYPSKSAMIGIIAASLGLHRDQDDEIQVLNQLDFVVRIDQPGELLRDFHTAHAIKKDGKPNRTYVSHRYYLQDAIFIIAISGSEVLMQKSF